MLINSIPGVIIVLQCFKLHLDSLLWVQVLGGQHHRVCHVLWAFAGWAREDSRLSGATVAGLADTEAALGMDGMVGCSTAVTYT